MAWPEPDRNRESNSKKVKNDKNKGAEQEPQTKPLTRDPMQGVTLKMILVRLVDRYGWDDLAKRIRINCFASDPSISSSLKFLRRTPWARDKVETLYRQTDWPE